MHTKRLLFLFSLLLTLGSTTNAQLLPEEYTGALPPINTRRSDLRFFEKRNIDRQLYSENPYGIIGASHQRFYIHFLSVEKDWNTPLVYRVTGKTRVKGNICDFQGTITLIAAYPFRELDYGVDDSRKGEVKAQWVIVAKYSFLENPKQRGTGLLTGKAYYTLEMNPEGEIYTYSSCADGLMGNAYVGTWQSYKTNQKKKCNWASYRVPEANADFDNGAAEMHPTKKYHPYGWGNYHRAWEGGDKQAQAKEREEWWR